LEIVEDGEQRFWQVHVDDTSVHLRWGVDGGRVSRLTKELPSSGKANAEARRLIRQHKNRGYQEVELDSPSE